MNEKHCSDCGGLKPTPYADLQAQVEALTIEKQGMEVYELETRHKDSRTFYRTKKQLMEAVQSTHEQQLCFSWWSTNKERITTGHANGEFVGWVVTYKLR